MGMINAFLIFVWPVIFYKMGYAEGKEKGKEELRREIRDRMFEKPTN